MRAYSSRWKFIPILFVVVLLAGCLDDDDEMVAPTAAILSGTAATGAPIVGGVVTVDCASGDNLPATTDANGNWSVTISGQTAPCAVKVVAAGGAEYFSFAPAFNSVVNVTPLTSLIVANLSGEDPATWFGGLDPTRFAAFDSTAEIDAAVTAVTTALGLNTALGSNHPVRTAFTATTGNVIDDVLEAFQNAMASAGTNFATLLADARNATITPPAGFNSAFATAFSTFPSGGAGGGGGGSGTSSLTASNTTPNTGAGTLQVTSITVEDAGGAFAGTTNRVTAVGTVNGSFAQVKLYYTIATGAIWNVSYAWGGNANLPENSAFKSCDVSCAGTSISGNTVTLSNLQLPDGTPTLATLNGTITSTSITTGTGENGGGNGGGGAPANLGALTASDNGSTQFGASFAPTSMDSVADIGLGWQYKWSVSATHFIQLNGSTVTILNGNPTWQKPLAPPAQLAFDAVNGTLSFTNLTTTTAVGGSSGPLVLNGTLNLTPLNSGPITLTGTGVNYTGSGFASPVATFAATATAEVWTWQDARGTTMKLTHVLTTGNYQLSFTGMGATPYLSSMGSLNALGISIDTNGKTVTFSNTSIANNNTSTAATVNGIVSIP